MNNPNATIRTRLTLAEAVLLIGAGRATSPALKRLQEHGPLHRPPPPDLEDWWEAKHRQSHLPSDLAKEALRRWYRKRGGSLPDHIVRARDQTVALIGSGMVEAWGIPCDNHGSDLGPEERLDAHRLGAGALVGLLDTIELESDWMAPGGFGRDARYRAVQLDQGQLLAWVQEQSNPGQRRHALPSLAEPLPPEQVADDPLEKPYWSRLQVELWVCTSSKEAVRWAAHEPGCTRLLDLDEKEPPYFDDEAELIGVAISTFGYIRTSDVARREVVAAETDGRLRAYHDPHSGSEFFKRDDVLALWPDEQTSDERHAAQEAEPGPRHVPVAELREWLGRNNNVKLAEGKGLAEARAQLSGRISRSTYRDARQKVAAERGLSLQPGRPPKCAGNCAGE